MTRREIASHYKGSAAGLLWALLTPVSMLCVYTFVFSEILGLRWGIASGEESKVHFALILFTGLLCLNLFSEVLNKAPGLILVNVNYVKKVVFPLEILPIITLAAALFHASISVVVLLIAIIFFGASLHWTVFLIPLVIAPLLILILGIAWFLAAFGVFIRDVSQPMSMITTFLMFLSPVFYPIETVPLAYRPYIMANPLTFIIEQVRSVLIWGRTPDWAGLFIYFCIAISVAWAGFAWFQKTRKGFADVL